MEALIQRTGLAEMELPEGFPIDFDYLDNHYPYEFLELSDFLPEDKMREIVEAFEKLFCEFTGVEL